MNCQLSRSYVLTENPSDKPWLSYLLEVFQDVTQIDTSLVDIHSVSPLNGTKIYYTPTRPHISEGIHIPELPIDDRSTKATLRFDGDLSRKSVLEGDEILIHHFQEDGVDRDGLNLEGRRLIFGFDLLKNAFLRLSCAAERRLEREKGPQHSYCSRGIVDSEYLKPIVNYLFELLRLAVGLFNLSLPATSSNFAEHPSFLLSHDIDAVNKTFLKSAKQSVMNMAKLPRTFRRHGAARGLEVLKSALILPFVADDFDHIESWRDWDRAAGFETSYYVYARLPARTISERIKAGVFDPDYDVANNADLSARLRALHRAGSTIGLHGSFSSFNDAERLASEKKILEQSIDAPVDQVRQHWLRFRFDGTWRAQEEAGFETDAGFGFNNQVGFRSWLAHPHHPWDERNQKAHKIRVIPMVAMDSTLFDYLLLSEIETLEKLKYLVEETQQFGGQVNINWHSHSCSKQLNWHKAYIDFLGQSSHNPLLSNEVIHGNADLRRNALS